MYLRAVAMMQSAWPHATYDDFGRATSPSCFTLLRGSLRNQALLILHRNAVLVTSKSVRVLEVHLSNHHSINARIRSSAPLYHPPKRFLSWPPSGMIRISSLAKAVNRLMQLMFWAVCHDSTNSQQQPATSRNHSQFF